MRTYFRTTTHQMTSTTRSLGLGPQSSCSPPKTSTTPQNGDIYSNLHFDKPPDPDKTHKLNLRCAMLSVDDMILVTLEYDDTQKELVGAAADDRAGPRRAAAAASDTHSARVCAMVTRPSTPFCMRACAR